MADNVIIPVTGTGDATPSIRTKDNGGVETQITALDLNPAGAESLMAGFMPIQGNSTALTQLQNAATSGNGTALSVAGMGTVVFVQTANSSNRVANFEATTDDTNWVALNVQNVNATTGLSAPSISSNAVGHYVANCAGYSQVRARVSGGAPGTMTMYARAFAQTPRVGVGVDLTSDLVVLTTSYAPDSVANFPYVYNQTGGWWERARSGKTDGLTDGVPVVGNYVWSGAAWNRVVMPGTDAITAGAVGSAMLGYNGTGWERLRSGVPDNQSTGILAGGMYAYNGSTWDRVRLTGSTGNLKSDIASVAGTTTDTNSGSKSAGTLRVVLATDQPQLTNALKVDGSAVNQPVTLAAAAAAIAKAEDSASADADVGVPSMAVRKAAPANTSGTDGDYEMLQMSAGRLWASSDITLAGTAVSGNSGSKDAGTVRVVLATDQPQLTAALKVDGSAVNQPVTLAAGAAAIAKAEDVASVDGDVGVPAMAIRKATPANTSGTDGDYEMLQMSAGRVWTSSDITLAGTAVDGNSGNKSAGTLRVVLATDQPTPTNPLNVQQNFNVGRTPIFLTAVAAAAGTTTTETAITLVKSAGTGATSSAVSFVVTSGKRFRITAISVATRGNSTATAQSTTFNFRINTGGAVITSSTPIIFSARSATPATALAWDRFSIPIPDGFEITGDGTLQFGMTAAATYTTNAPTWDVFITGFEYTP